MAEIPHLALPFRFEDGRAAVNEQDTPDDVADCVEAVLRTRPGEREERPDFGVPDPTFSQAPIDADGIASIVETWEPRARLVAQEAPDVLDDTVRRVRLSLTLEDA
jgi:phage baseplate assembly protein W